jgi:hypothetical protein
MCLKVHYDVCELNGNAKGLATQLWQGRQESWPPISPLTSTLNGSQLRMTEGLADTLLHSSPPSCLPLYLT